jgi:hypothetical protein
MVFNVVERVNGLSMVKGLYNGTCNYYIPLSSGHSLVGYGNYKFRVMLM